MADSDNEGENRQHSRKKKRLRVEMSLLNDTPDRIPPIVGYFSSGYNPRDSIDPPQIRVFRNKNHRSTRLDLVVKPNESSVEFVGKSYEGETALHQSCHYALGILDKDSQTLKVVPIAANKILRLEPRVMKSSEGLEEGAEKTVRNLSDATSVFGSKKQRNVDKRMRLLIEQTKDPSAREHLQDEMLDADMNNEVLEDTKAIVGPNIPPHDLSAKTPEKAYLLDEIIPKGEQEYLFDILSLLDSGIGANATFWEENYYPSFVANRIHKLKEIKAVEERNQHAVILSYITHLVNFWKLTGSRRARPDTYGDAMHKYKIPRVVYQKLANLFLDQSSMVLSTDKKELILGYILVLTLFADKFKSKATDIAKDLGMRTADLKPYYTQLGCKLQNFGLSNYMWILPVPLKPEAAKMKRRSKK